MALRAPRQAPKTERRPTKHTIMMPLSTASARPIPRSTACVLTLQNEMQPRDDDWGGDAKQTRHRTGSKTAWRDDSRFVLVKTVETLGRSLNDAV